MKVSIRVSIIALFLGLLGLIGLLVIATNYLILDNILFKAAQLSFFHTTQRVAEKVQHYLSPLEERVHISKELIDQKVILPDSMEKFQKYLLKIIEDNPNLYGAYWGDVKGNLYLVVRKGGDRFLTEVIKRDAVPPEATQRMMNAHGKAKGHRHHASIFDPRLRPWYLAAEKGKHHIWSSYLFKKFLNEAPVMGLTSATPVYSSQGKLMGVFGMDMTLDSIAKHIFRLKLSKNTIIFICDDQGRVIASSNMGKASRLNAKGVSPSINAINMPHIAASYAYYKHYKQKLFSYRYENNRYIASYAAIPTSTKKHWYVAIVTPEVDAIYFLRQVIYISVFATLIVFLIGFLLIYTLSSRISRPIIRLTKNSEKVSHFELNSLAEMKESGFSEINNIQDAFNAMKEKLKAFSHYLPVTLVKQLLEETVSSNGKKVERHLTFLFIDISRFTFLPNNLDSKMLLQDLSEYTDMVSRIINQYHGNFDTYLGNGMIAFWNAPLDDKEYINNTCDCALACEEALKELNLKWKEMGRVGLTINIGINKGLAMINSSESKELLNYSDISGSINLAVRLQELNKNYQTSCIVDESVFQKTKDFFEFRLLDLVGLQGGDQPIYIYELLGRKGVAHFTLTEDYQVKFNKAFNAYKEGDFQDALVIFEQMKKTFVNDSLIDLYIDRCKILMTSPSRDWKGVWLMRME